MLTISIAVESEDESKSGYVKKFQNIEEALDFERKLTAMQSYVENVLSMSEGEGVSDESLAYIALHLLGNAETPASETPAAVSVSAPVSGSSPRLEWCPERMRAYLDPIREHLSYGSILDPYFTRTGDTFHLTSRGFQKFFRNSKKNIRNRFLTETKDGDVLTSSRINDLIMPETSWEHPYWGAARTVYQYLGIVEPTARRGRYRVYPSRAAGYLQD